MTEQKQTQQREIVAAAIDAGINWFDTARTYGNGASEENLGRTLRELGAFDRIHIATKVRLMPDQLDNIGHHVRQSVETSLQVLGVDSVALIQIHNAITGQRNEIPTSITTEDVAGPCGILEELLKLKRQGMVQHLGLTGTGEPACLESLIETGEFESIQVPFSLANPSAAFPVSPEFTEFNHGGIINFAAEHGLFTFAIRVFAGGALLGRKPSAYTFKTPFFPLDLYERDVERARQIRDILTETGTSVDMSQLAIRSVLESPTLDSAIIGLGDLTHVANATQAVNSEPLDSELLNRIMRV